MAKISANGATECARIKTRTKTVPFYEYLWVMTSDGRVLRRGTGEAGTGYTIYLRGWKGEKTRDALMALVRRKARGHEVLD